MEIRVIVLSFYLITSSCEAHLVKHVLDHADRSVSGIANVFSGGILGGGLKLNFNAEINSRGESVPLEEKHRHHGGLLGLLHHNRHGPPPINDEPPPLHHGPPPMIPGPPRNYQEHQGQYGYGGDYGYGTHSESGHQGSNKYHSDHSGSNIPHNGKNHQEQQGHYGNSGNYGYGTNSESGHQGSDKPRPDNTGSNIPFNSQNTNSYSYSYAEAGSFSSSNSEGHPHQTHNTPSKDKNAANNYPAQGYDNSYPKYPHAQGNTDEASGTYSSESSNNFHKHDEQLNNHYNHGGSYGTHSYNNNQGHDSDKNKPQQYERTTTHKTDQKEINNDQPYYIPLSFEDNKHDREKVDVNTPDKDKYKRDENKNTEGEEYSIDIRSNFDQ